MSQKGLFHSTLFGGYNKSEVEVHIKELEEKISEYEKERPSLKELKAIDEAMEKIEELRSENERLMKEIRIHEAEREAVSKVLLDAKVKADVIVAKANSQAEEIITKAEADRARRNQDMEMELQKEFQRRIAEFVTAKCQLGHCQENLGQAFDQMGKLLDFMIQMEKEIPTYVEDILGRDKEHEDAVEDIALGAGKEI